MHHVAIMKKSWGLTEKILNGQKTIESRWYTTRRAPWDKIKKEDVIYFKDSGDAVRIQADIEQVLQFENLTPKRVREILKKYGGADGIEKENIKKFFNIFKNKRYCILVFLKNSKKIKPFEINKSGFGMMAAWISVDSIQKIKI